MDQDISTLNQQQSLTQVVKMNVTGMKCSACAFRVERGLSKVNGVRTVNVNLASRIATVEYDALAVGDLMLVDVVHKLGYRASIGQDVPNYDVVELKASGLKTMTAQLILSVILSLPFVWIMLGSFPFLTVVPIPHILMNPLVQTAIVTPIQFGIGKQFYVSSYRGLLNKKINLDFFITLGTSAAYFYSLFLTVESLITPMQLPTLYYKTSAILITFMVLRKRSETRAKESTSHPTVQETRWKTFPTRIVTSIREAQNKRTEDQRLADSISSEFFSLQDWA